MLSRELQVRVLPGILSILGVGNTMIGVVVLSTGPRRIAAGMQDHAGFDPGSGAFPDTVVLNPTRIGLKFMASRGRHSSIVMTAIVPPPVFLYTRGAAVPATPRAWLYFNLYSQSTR